MHRILALLIVVPLLVAPVQSALPLHVDGQPLPSLAPMLERVTPAVVNISTVNHVKRKDHPLLNDPFFRWFFDAPKRNRKRETQSLGSGVIVDAGQGYVLTNNHVIDGADEIRVTLKDGRRFNAELLGAAEETDIAVLRIEADNLVAVRLHDAGKLRVGDFVVAIGNPFGLSQTVTSGIVSALGRSGLGIEGYENFIQTDASINPGNSGGPLVNLNGELVGLNTAILAPSGGNVGIGFAIPTDMLSAIMDQIIEHGGVNRGTFGVAVQNLDADLARALGLASQDGAIIRGVEPGSAAERAGLRPGDLVQSLNGRRITTATDMETRLALLRVGDKVNLAILREGRAQRIEARIADPYESYVAGHRVNGEFRGALLGEVQDQSSFGRNAGIAVGPVQEDSSAWRVGLREGDVIFQVNRTRVQTLDEIGAVAGAGDGIWQLKLRRGNRLVTLVSR